MDGWKQLRSAIAGISILPAFLGTGYAQDQPRGVDVGRRNVQPPVVGAAEAAASDVKPAIELTRESRQFLEETTELTAELRQHGTFAFQRGLMPLPDYLNQLAVGEDVELRASDLTDPRQRNPILRRQVQLLEDAWERVAWREPGVPGWRSDALLAELALTEARLNLAEENGDTVASAALHAESELLAEAHFEQRALDYRTAFATLPMMVRSVNLETNAALARNPGSRTAAALEQDRRLALETALSRTEAWSSLDAGIGRADEVATARLDRDVVAMQSLDAEGGTLTRETVTRVSREFENLFQHQQEYYRTGTASLYDLAQTWVAWHDVHRLAASNSNDAPGESEIARRGDALRELQSLADNVADLRGRQAADVTFVRLAGRLDALDDLYREADPRGDYLP